MLTPEEDVEVTSLRKRGSTISAIARHVGHDRKTVRSYLSVEREPSVRERAKPDVFDRFEPYVRQRLVDDQHVWGTTLFDEVVALGYDRSYQTFTRKLRERDLRPHCEPCSASHGRAHVDIEHPPGAEIQWDWLELDETPWGVKAYVLVGALAHSSRFRAWFSGSDDQAHLVVGIDEILHRLGGTARRWRVDRIGSIILTANRGVASWGEIFADTTVAAAMLDRLLHRSVVINITGESYRMRAHRARSRKLTKGGDA
jgi:transposase